MAKHCLLLSLIDRDPYAIQWEEEGDGLKRAVELFNQEMRELARENGDGVDFTEAEWDCSGAGLFGEAESYGKASFILLQWLSVGTELSGIPLAASLPIFDTPIHGTAKGQAWLDLQEEA